MSMDDLPPQPQRHDTEEEVAAGRFGQLFGGVLWLVFFFALAGGGFYLLMRWTH